MKEEILKRLQLYVQQKSVDELKSTRIDELSRILNVYGREMQGIIDFLDSKGALSYKYNMRCSECGINHTIYQNEMYKKERVCEECGEVIDFNEIKKKGKLLLVIDKQEVLNLDEEIDFKKEAISKIVHIAEIHNVKDKGERKNKMKVFIGSSKEAKDSGELRTIAGMIEEFNHEPIKWCDNGVFVAGEYTFDCLVEKANEVDAAIFIFRSDDITWYRGDLISSVRDNVIFEYGLFAGRLGRKNVIMIYSGNPNTISDLHGLVHYNLDNGKNQLEGNLDEWLKRISKIS